MSSKVQSYLILDSIGIAINTFISLVLCYFCSLISYDFIAIGLKIVVITFASLVNIFIVSFFLLYWWSDIKWTQCKQKAKRFKQKFCR